MTITDSTTFFDPTLAAVPFFVALTLIEVAVARYRDRRSFDFHDSAASLGMGIGYVFVAAAAGTVNGAAMMVVFRHRLFDITYGWLSLFVLFLLNDFIAYWMHRLAHERRVFWADHTVHHSSRHLNLSTSSRLSWTSFFTFEWLCWLPLAWIGYSPNIIVFFMGANMVYGAWLHTEHVGKLPWWFEAVFCTPSQHRVHHAVNPRYLDANFGATLVIWDRLFGTFVAECDDEPCVYGLVHNIATSNPLRLAVFGWVDLFNDLRSAPDWRTRLKYIVSPTGWRHDGTGLTTADIQAEWRLAQQGVASDDTCRAMDGRPGGANGPVAYGLRRP